MISRNRSAPSFDAMSIECTTSANNTVTCLYSAGVVGASTGTPQEWQNRAFASSSAPQLRHTVAAVICHSADLDSELTRRLRISLTVSVRPPIAAQTPSGGVDPFARTLHALLSNQALLEELDDTLARLVCGVAFLLTHLVGQHRMRHPRKPVLVPRRRVDLDDLE